MFIKKRYHLFIIIILLISFIYTYININHKNKSIYKIDDILFKGYITNINKSSDYYKITIKVSNKESLICYSKELETYKLNDYIMISGKLNIIDNSKVFNTFNYSTYLYNKHIYYTCNVDSIKLLKNNKNNLYKIKNFLIDRISNYKSSSYLFAFILGDNSNIDKNIRLSYQENGISHLFAVSGMHISFFTSFLLLVFNKLKIKLSNSYILITIFLFIYMFLVNFTPSVERSFFMFLFLLIKNKLNLNIKTIYILLLVMSICLFINPFYIFNIGFLYSFTISMFLIYFKPKGIFSVSVISFLGSLPITLYNFNQINVLSILYNLFFVPFVSLIIFPISFLVLIFKQLDSLYFILISILESVSLFLNSISISKLIFSKPSVFIVIIYYILIVLGLKKRKSMFLLVSLLIIHYNYNLIFNVSFVTFIYVGQGDSSLIFLNNKGILIDTGDTKNNNGSNIISYLKSMGIKNLEYLIITHGDLDHIGEAEFIVKNFNVKTVIFNCGQYNNLEKSLIKVLDKKKIKYNSCVKELSINNYKLQFLNTNIYDNENDNSTVIYLNYKNYKFLFMGDAGIKREKDIIEKYDLKDIDFLKVGHHGSNTSSSKEFINSTDPKYSIISVGKNNRYGHPKKDVLEILKNSKVYRTDKDGSIEIKLDKSRYKINIPLS